MGGNTYGPINRMMKIGTSMIVFPSANNPALTFSKKWLIAIISPIKSRTEPNAGPKVAAIATLKAKPVIKWTKWV